MKNRIYAIGDIHGELAMLERAIDVIETDGGPEAKVVFIGDYIDRGSESRGVVDFLLKGISTGKNWNCLLGNHDRMFTLFMEDYPQVDVRLRVNYHWLHARLGGRETLASYGVSIDDNDTLLSIHNRARAAVPLEHIQFLRSLPYSLQAENLLFVHAGIRPGIPFEQQQKDDLIWIREEFLQDTRPHPWLIVHGHTPVAQAQHFGNRVNLDSGAGYGNALSAVVFEGSACWLLTETGRTALVPQALA